MKAHLAKDEAITITFAHPTDKFQVGDQGKIVAFFWDYPNWEYTIAFSTGRLTGDTARVWDSDLKASSGRILDNTSFNQAFQSQSRDGQAGYQE
jgi:hypothetical protein